MSVAAAVKVISIILNCSCCRSIFYEKRAKLYWPGGPIQNGPSAGVSFRRGEVIPGSGHFSTSRTNFTWFKLSSRCSKAFLDMANSICTRCWLRLSHSRTQLLPLGLQGQVSQQWQWQWQWRPRRGMASMSPESQQKVISSLETVGRIS